MTSTTTTVPIDPTDAATWIGHHFVVVDEFGAVRERQELLFLGRPPSFIVIDGDEADVYPWFTGFTSFQRGDRIDVFIVSPDAIEHPPEESDADEPILPIDPGSDEPYTVTVWAVTPSADLYSGFRITDTMEIEIPQSILATQEFLSIGYQPWLCELDPELPPEALFGFFDVSDDIQIETFYPPYLAFRVKSAALVNVPSDMVSCIVRLDPDNF